MRASQEKYFAFLVTKKPNCAKKTAESAKMKKEYNG
jgi:hypothetical protein